MFLWQYTSENLSINANRCLILSILDMDMRFIMSGS